MKFGGTSVADATAMSRVVRIISGGRARRPVVAVSALAGVTDQLLDLAARAGDGYGRANARALQAASRCNVTVILTEIDLPDAMRRLHDRFFVNTEHNDRLLEAAGQS